MPPYGRGGAGNILTSTQLDEANTRLEHDLEANQKNRQLRSADAMDTDSRPAQAYASSGRGGAGNMVTPTALKSTIDPSTAPTPSSQPPSPPPPTPAVAATTATPPVSMATGRGGAGNMMHASQVQREREAMRRQREEETGEMVRERARQDVEVGLRAPGRAVLGGEKAGRGW